MDYRSYKLSFIDVVKVLILSAAVTGAIAVLFYKSAWACVLIVPVTFFFARKEKVQKKEQRMQDLSVQFLDAMRAVSAGLLSGYSMENAWREAEKELEMLHGKSSYMYLELVEINRSVTLSIPIENLLSDFGQRTGVEDIESFAEVFLFAKRSGGDFVKMMEKTTEHLRMRQETRQEINVAVAARRMEQNVMNVVPLFILAYLRVSSGDFLDALYGNPFGILFMSGCLLAYAAAILLADHILRISV